MDALDEIVTTFSPITKLNLEIYRGDSFQILVEDVEYAMTIALAVRAKLISMTPAGQEVWDARLALGIGKVSFTGRSIMTSDGDAFRYSGRAFDSLGKNQLAVVSSCADFNDDMYLITKFVDDIVSSWTTRQAYVIYNELVTHTSQRELAARLKMSPQNLNYIWNASKCPLIIEYLRRYQYLVRKYI